MSGQAYGIKTYQKSFNLGNLLITIKHQHKLSAGQEFRNGKIFVVINKLIPLNLKLLTEKQRKGYKYGVLSNTRIALSAVLIIKGNKFGQDDLLTRFMKGAFNAETPTSRSNVV